MTKQYKANELILSTGVLDIEKMKTPFTLEKWGDTVFQVHGDEVMISHNGIPLVISTIEQFYTGISIDGTWVLDEGERVVRASTKGI